MLSRDISLGGVFETYLYYDKVIWTAATEYYYVLFYCINTSYPVDNG